MKPRDFWIEDMGMFFEIRNEKWKGAEGIIHVREVVPIDWDKVREDFFHEILFKDLGAVEQMFVLEQLVEKQLAGDDETE